VSHKDTKQRKRVTRSNGISLKNMDIDSLDADANADDFFNKKTLV
jgi:hypothetical protein